MLNKLKKRIHRWQNPLPTEFTIREKEPYWPINREAVEERFKAKFIAEMAHKFGNGWSEQPLAIFYQESPPDPQFSNYFGLFFDEDQLLTITGIHNFDPWVDALLTPANEVIWSAWVHDFFYDSRGIVAIDGGRDYTKLVGAFDRCEEIRLNVETGKIKDHE